MFQASLAIRWWLAAPLEPENKACHQSQTFPNKLVYQHTDCSQNTETHYLMMIGIVGQKQPSKS